MMKGGSMVNSRMERLEQWYISKLPEKFRSEYIIYGWLCLVIVFLIWFLSFWIRRTLNLKDTNNKRMIYDYNSLGGTKIGGVEAGNPNHKYLLRDYYVNSSYNSCCGGNIEKDFVDMIPLKTVIKQGARLLDFEIYSMNGSPVVAAGTGPNTNGKYYLKGTYNSIPFKKTMSYIRSLVFNGSQCPNPDDPLFLSFRIKTNNRNIYPIMANVISKTFSGRFLGPKYSHNGKYNTSGMDVIPNIPLLNLKRKVIIIIQDPTNNYRETEFEEYINMSGKGNEGDGLPFVQIYKNWDIVHAHDIEVVKDDTKKFLGITMPDTRPLLSNSSAPIHHSCGCQFVMMNYSLMDEQMLYYINFFNKKGSAFRLKPDHLRYFDVKIAPPKKQDPKLSYGPRQTSMLGGAYKPSL